MIPKLKFVRCSCGREDVHGYFYIVSENGEMIIPVCISSITAAVHLFALMSPSFSGEIVEKFREYWRHETDLPEEHDGSIKTVDDDIAALKRARKNLYSLQCYLAHLNN